MDGASGNWRPVQGDASGMNMDAAAAGDWRAQLQLEARGRIVNKIMNTLQRHLPIYGQEGLGELKNIARRFEEKIFTAATSQSDYLRRISLKMLTMETKTQNTGDAGQMPSNPTNQNPPDPGAHVLQPQVQNTGQSLSIPGPNQSQTRQQTLTPGIQNNLASAAVQGSASLASIVPSINGLSQSMASAGQTSNLQSMSAISLNMVNNSGQGISPNLYANSQRQIQGKQQQQHLVSQQPPQNPHLYPVQLQQQQQQMLKAKLSHSTLMQSQLHQQQQQQQQLPLSSATQLQSSQQPIMQMTSSLQSSQTSLQQAQPPLMQSGPHSGHQQSQPNLLQQPSSLPQQHSHAVLRQQQSQPSTHLQASSLQQQSASITQQSGLPLQQQQQQQSQLLGNQSNISNMQQNQLLSQPNSIPDMQQQRRLAVQQNNLMSIQQSQQMLNQQNMSLHQQVVPQNNMSGLQQLQSQQHLQQQSQLLGSQPNMPNIHQHHQAMLMQPQKTAAQQPQQQQQQAQQTATSLMQSQGQQTQSNPAQQQHMSQIQNQTVQLQQQMAMQQQGNPLQRELQQMQQMQQRLQAPGGLLQPQNAFEQQKPVYQSQRALPEASSSSMDSTAQTSQSGPDWLEETYQKLQSMRERYYADLNEIHQRIIQKCQQHEAQAQPGKPDQLEGMKKIKCLMDRLLGLLQTPKSSIQPNLKEKLPYFEKQMFNVITSNRRKVISPHLQGQQQIPRPGGNAQSMPQQQSSQTPIQQLDSQGNQMSPIVVQGSVTSVQSPAVSSMQNGSMTLPNHVGVPAAHQNIMNALQPSSNIDSSQSSALTSLQEGPMGSLPQGGMGSLQQATFNTSTQNNMNALVHTNNAMQANIGPIQPNANALQNQHVKHEHQQQLLQSQQIKQQLQRQIQQKQQSLQQQPHMQHQYQQQQKQLQSAQLQSHQIPQLHQLNEMNDLKVRQASAIKQGIFQPHLPGVQRQIYHQQLKQGSSFPISSPQSLQVPSPQISQHSSPQVEQSFLSSVPKAGTPLQSANSPFVVPSPSTPLDDHEKQVSGISAVSIAANVGHPQISVAPTQGQSLTVGTPGISASPLLDEYIGSDVSHVNAQATITGKPSATGRPIERLVKAVQSLSPRVLSSSVSDIGSVVSMIDRIAGSAPGNGSRAAIGEDLVAMTKCRLQAKSFMSQDGSVGTKKMKRHTNAMPLNAVSSAGSINDSFKRSSTGIAELESTATSRVKRPKVEATHALEEEIREINQQLIDTVVDITDEDADSIAATAEGGEGTVIKCSYCAVAVSPSLKLQFASAQASPISPMRLLVPSSYPYTSPVLLDKIPIESSKESEDLSAKAMSRFSISLRSLSQPISLRDMVRAWDVCARKVIEEYARQNGGGSFSSRYGSWENCVPV